ncbi:hypothetical protein AAVH_31075 [Aphelenchoides avenae]|nr:hypothetical protein AAVH_31075 [Aphelenchus avenae]
MAMVPVPDRTDHTDRAGICGPGPHDHADRTGICGPGPQDHTDRTGIYGPGTHRPRGPYWHLWIRTARTALAFAVPDGTDHADRTDIYGPGPQDPRTALAFVFGPQDHTDRTGNGSGGYMIASEVIRLRRKAFKDWKKTKMSRRAYATCL